MASDDKIRLALEILGAENVKDLNAQVKALKAAFAEVAPAAAKAEADTYDLADAYEVLGEEIHDVFTSAQKLGPAIKDVASTTVPAAEGAENLAKKLEQVAAASDKSKSKVAGFGQAALQSGRAVQDFAQGGVGGILNNIEGITQSLGLGSGLAGVLTILGVAAVVAGPQIRKLWESLGNSNAKDVVSQFDALTKKIDELKDKKVKLAIDSRELDEAERQLARLKKAQSEYEASLTRQTPEEAAAGKAIDDTLGEAGEPEINTAIRQRRIDQQTAGSAELAGAKSDEAKAQGDLDAARRMKLKAVTDDQINAALLLESRATAEVKAAGERKNKVIGEIEAEAGRFYGNLRNDAIKGHGKIQAAAQQLLADELEAIGRADVANAAAAAIGLNSPAKKKADEAKKKLDESNKKVFDDEDKIAEARAARAISSEEAEINAFSDEAADKVKKDQAGVKIRDDQNRDRIKQDNTNEATSIKSSGIGDAAAEMLARVQAAGGVKDNSGRFHKLNNDQIFEHVQKQVAQYLHRQIGVDGFGRPVRANAGMSAEATRDLSTRITAGGQQDLTHRMLATSGQQGSNTQKLIGIADMLSDGLTHLQEQTRQNTMAIGNLGKKAQATRRNGAQRPGGK